MNKKLLTIVASVTLLVPHIAAAFTQEKEGIQLKARHYAPDELVIDADGWQIKAANLEQKGFRPVHISVQNNSKEPIAISARSVLVKQADNDSVARLFKHRSILRPLSWFTPVFIPLLALDIVTFLGTILVEAEDHAVRVIILFLSKFFTFSHCVTIPGAIYHWRYLRGLNKNFDVLLQKQMLSDEVIIQPGELVEKTLFLERDLNDKFVFRIFNTDTHETMTVFKVEADFYFGAP